ncbi:MAG: ribulose-phosphate 3-epimerase [Candidatus Woesearchaeota archaeon]
MNYQIIPAIIAKNQKELNVRIVKVYRYFKTIQLDVMDGIFVKNKSLIFNFRLPRNKKYEAHLMVKNPISWIKKYDNNVQRIVVHVESENVEKALNLIKSMKKQAGIAINPKTPLNKYLKFLKKINYVTILAVNPGKYGSKFIPSALKKIKEIKKINPKINIEVDGGLGDKNIKQAKKAGANLFISGSYLQNSKDIESSIKKLKSLIK